jgi:aspartyl protease family protein
MTESFAHGLWIILVLLLVGSGLVARRIPLARLVAWSAGWALLFLAVYFLFTLIEPQLAVWQQSRRGGEVVSVTSSGQTPGASSTAPSSAQGATVSIPMAQDGHYWVDGSTSGRTIRFLVDSGASITALSASSAETLALPQDPMGRTVTMQTANGEILANRSSVQLMDIGSIRTTDLAVVVSPAFGEVNVLGMNFLNKLKSWRVENGVMVLEP